MIQCPHCYWIIQDDGMPADDLIKMRDGEAVLNKRNDRDIWQSWYRELVAVATVINGRIKLKKMALILIVASTVAFANEGGEGGKGEGGNFLKLEPFTVNLSAGRVIQFVPQAKLGDPKEKERVTPYMPIIRFELIKAMLGQEAATANTPVFIESFALKAMKIINTATGGEYVKSVLFDRWIVQ